MSRLRRYYGGSKLYFVTNVTFQRKRILVEHADLLHHALTNVKERLRFEIIAHVILPDHFHAIIDPGEYDLSNLLQRIKQSFSMNYPKRTGASGRVWQLRFWDHIIRDQDDMNKHIDYIHYNPVKHGLVHRPFDHAHSSIHDYHRAGYYPRDWGTTDPPIFTDDFGE